MRSCEGGIRHGDGGGYGPSPKTAERPSVHMLPGSQEFDSIVLLTYSAIARGTGVNNLWFQTAHPSIKIIRFAIDLSLRLF
jgi:hypothetical protein